MNTNCARGCQPRLPKPGRLAQLLKSTPLGQVNDDRWLRELRAEAGNRIDDGSTVDLLRLTAWLAARRHLQVFPVDDEAVPGESYPRKKERERERKHWDQPHRAGHRAAAAG